MRGAAAEVLLAAARRVGEDRAALVHLGRVGLLRAGAALLTDKAPAARSSSRQVMQLLKARSPPRPWDCLRFVQMGVDVSAACVCMSRPFLGGMALGLWHASIPC